jgi:hypothetical protein
MYILYFIWNNINILRVYVYNKNVYLGLCFENISTLSIIY